MIWVTYRCDIQSHSHFVNVSSTLHTTFTLCEYLFNPSHHIHTLWISLQPFTPHSHFVNVSSTPHIAFRLYMKPSQSFRIASFSRVICCVMGNVSTVITRIGLQRFIQLLFPRDPLVRIYNTVRIVVYPWRRCSSLEEVLIPLGCAHPWRRCSSLEEVLIPGGGAHLFRMCSSLEEVLIFRRDYRRRYYN